MTWKFRSGFDYDKLQLTGNDDFAEHGGIDIVDVSIGLAFPDDPSFVHDNNHIDHSGVERTPGLRGIYSNRASMCSM